MKKNIINSSIPAFTIIELLIALIISGTVIGLSYLYFNQFQHYLKETYNTESLFNEIGNLQMVIESDFQNASAVIVEDRSTLRIDLDSVYYLYSFSESIITRNNGSITDTFKIHINDLKFIGWDENNEKLLRSLTFNINTLPKQEMRIVISKSYPSQTLFQLLNK